MSDVRFTIELLKKALDNYDDMTLKDRCFVVGMMEYTNTLYAELHKIYDQCGDDFGDQKVAVNKASLYNALHPPNSNVVN